jgi:hypothetical protein
VAGKVQAAQFAAEGLPIIGKKAIKLRLRGCFALRSTWCRGYSTPMGMRPALLTASAIFYRSAADRGRFARLTLIAAPLILVLTGCSASSSFSGQANKPNPNQAAFGSNPECRSDISGTAGLRRLATLPEAISCGPVSRLNADASAKSNSNSAASAEYLHTFRPALLTRRIPGTQCDRCRRAARQSGSHGLAAVS